MATITWTDQPNGVNLGVMRGAFNTFNTSVKNQVNQNTTDISALDTRVGDLETSEGSLDGRVTQNEADIDALQAPEKTAYTPLATPPAHVEGQVYYDAPTGSFKVQGPLPGVEIAVGHDMHIHVINNSGAILEKGMAVRHNGVAAGKIQVVKAIATSFDNARVFGVVQEDIGIGEEGAIITFGEIANLDTFGVTVGVPLYLSDSVAGTYTEVAPDIVTRLGGVLTADAVEGRLFTSIINNTTLPGALGGLKGQTVGNETYNVTTTPQDLINYDTAETLVTVVDPLTGIITLPNDGEYRTNFVASISFPTATSTRSVTFEIYDVTDASIAFSYVKNIPRDATEDGVSFSYPFRELASNQYKMRIKSSTAIDVTFSNISFDIQSVNIK